MASGDDLEGEARGTRLMGPAIIGELPLALWLLIKGVNVERWHQRALSSTTSSALSSTTPRRTAPQVGIATA